jgi:hypothetical protein
LSYAVNHQKPLKISVWVNSVSGFLRRAHYRQAVSPDIVSNQVPKF